AGARALGRLAVDDAGRGLLVPALGPADPAAQGAVDLPPQAGAAPAVEGVAGGAFRGEVVGQGGTGAAVVRAIEDGAGGAGRVGGGGGRGPGGGRWWRAPRRAGGRGAGAAGGPTPGR